MFANMLFSYIFRQYCGIFIVNISLIFHIHIITCPSSGYDCKTCANLQFIYNLHIYLLDPTEVRSRFRTSSESEGHTEVVLSSSKRPAVDWFPTCILPARRSSCLRKNYCKLSKFQNLFFLSLKNQNF